MEGEPSPRWGHYSALVEGKFCVWGGRTKDFDKERSGLASTVHTFHSELGCWVENECTGAPPPGIYGCACTSAGHQVYMYGGSDGSQCLHKLNTRSWTWEQLSSAGPTKKSGCGMVTYDSKLVLFGGYGYSSSPTQPGAEFLRDTKFTDGRGWTNEVHTFDPKEGESI